MENKQMDVSAESKQISEADLGQVSGGWSENRYDPNICGKLSSPRSECRNVMLTENIALFDRWCDHFRVSDTWTEIIDGYKRKLKKTSCAMNGFPAYTEIIE